MSASKGRSAAVCGLAVTAAVVAGGIVGCGAQRPSQALAWACGTTSTPPVAHDPAHCPADRAAVITLPDGAVVRWYSAPAADIGDEEAPVPGQPLDGDWWDPLDRADLDEPASSTGKAPRSSRTSRTSAAPTRVRSGG